MAFFKKVFKKVNSKWYPQSVLVGGQVGTDQLSRRVAMESTVSPADVKAVLTSLSGVMGEYMAMGRSVKLDGIGSFYFRSSAKGNGVDDEKDVTAGLINGVKVRFIPETTFSRGGGKAKRGRRATRALTDVDIEWIDVATLAGRVSDDYIDGDDNGEEDGV